MFRLRRAAVTLTLGAGVVSGAVGVGVAGFSGVANAVTAGSIAAASAPTINATGSNQAAGNLTVTLPTTVIGATEYVDLLVTANAASATFSNAICYSGTPSITSNGVNVSATAVNAQAGSACPAGSSGNILQLTVPAQTPTSPATITISGIAYNTTSATGTLQVFGWTDSALNDTTSPPAATVTGQLVPYPTSNGTLPAAPPTNPTFSAVTAQTTPSVGIGASSQAGGNWQYTVTANGTTSGWVSGNQVAIEVRDTAGNNCSGNDYVYFSSAPKATVTTTGFGTTAAPTLGTPTLAYDATAPSNCGPTQPNVVLIPFTNGGTLPTGSSFQVTVSGITYNIGSTTPAGNVWVSGTYETGGATPTPIPGIATFTPGSIVGATAGPSNATVAALYVTANNPAVIVGASTNGSAISPVNIVEATAAQLAPGYVCLTLPAGDTFSTSATPTVKVASGNATVSTSAPTFQTSTGGTANDTVVFQVTGSSTTGNPSTVTVSGLSVNAGAVAGAQTIKANTAVSPTTCPAYAGAPNIGSATAFTIGKTTTQIFGATADATAAAELTSAFPIGTGCTVNNAVVLATDQNYPDALAGAYLASDLKTGEVITPTASLSTDALNAIRQEGITNVYVVGGPLAVSNAVISQLEATQAYTCGGTTPRTLASGAPQDLQVTQIYGQTMFDTAQDIAQFPGVAHVQANQASCPLCGLNLAAAYAGTNSSGGNGMYNDTSGNASTAPAKSGALRTAILATSQGWQDAMAAGALSYATDTPILITDPSTLSSQVSAAIANLGIQQVIVMGGPVAVSNAVVTSLQGMGESVLRIAGQDYTDTAVQLANMETSTVANAGLAWKPTNVVITRGDYFSDGLAGAAIAGGTAIPQPMLETFDPNTVGQYLTGFLKTAGTVGPSNNGTPVTSLTILGGPQAVTPTTISTMQGDL